MPASVPKSLSRFGKKASVVAAKMKASGRPSTHYAKTTGKLKKSKAK